MSLAQILATIAGVLWLAGLVALAIAGFFK